MALIQITVEVDEGSPYFDPSHKMGITDDAFDLLTDPFQGKDLSWLGEVQDVEKVT